MSERETQEALKLLSAKSGQYVAERKINRELVAVLKEARLNIMMHTPISAPVDIAVLLARINAALKEAGEPSPSAGRVALAQATTKASTSGACLCSKGDWCGTSS